MSDETVMAMTSFDETRMRPPVARRAPETREFHGDVFNDDYAWMRDKDAPEVREYVDAQNRYCEARMAHLVGLRGTLFEELKSHVEETDMSVPTRVNDYWYFTRTQEGRQYGIQCRLPIRGADDWDPPQVDPKGEPGSMPGEQIVFDANVEAQGHDFFRLGGMDLSRDGRWLLYGVDVTGDERYDFHIRDLSAEGAGEHTELPEVFTGIGGACLTPDGRYVFWVELDDAWRPCAIWRHKVGTPVESDTCAYREADERFWAGVGISFDERNVVIGTGSKTTTEVLMLPVDTPEGEFRAFIPRESGVEYDVSFACFEGAGENGADIPLAVVYHNAKNPNFEIDVIDMREHEPPYRLGEGVCVAAGSPYGCERGDDVEPGASARPIATPYFNPVNPPILQGMHGLGIEGIAIHQHFVSLSYRADGLPRVAMMTKRDAAEDFLAGRAWRFRELTPPALENDWDVDDYGDSMFAEAFGAQIDVEPLIADDTAGPHRRPSAQDSLSAFDGASADEMPGETRRLYSIGAGGNPSYEAPRMRYSFSSYTRPGELREIDPVTGEDVLLKRARVLGGFDARDYMERRVWITARDGERVPVSLVWRRDLPVQDAPMFITSYGAYEISSDPGFSVSRLSMLDRGVLYAVPHIRGGGEMGRAWYEQGRRLNKRHSFEDFVDATIALQDARLADARRTVANGGSAGGLLMGAVANLAPDRFAGIEADVPFVDALTSILDPSLPLTVTEWDEWGDPLHDAEVYRYMKSYTPYENLPESGPFPKIFITTSMNDTRVLVVEPLKWLAAMHERGFDAVAKIEVEAGHGGISGRYKQWEEVSYENAWCLSVMGIAR
ncbi:S9 family peptidase [Bifidobacterium eulemuris]|uniref:S9 family peptidase n=2 Tax=Bifidobacterium eulemuris TaxID=1765219 RepID=A0A7L9SRB0_9BIFI|nr:S9 family peptidase [Bifidobacterium eulemuris]QOL32707.1 S9 family peptidase [Bifidobacterium eulemuris]